MRKRRAARRHEDEEVVMSSDELEITPEELELQEFLENLGPQGISEVSLYRVLPTGKQKFVTSGPPSEFSELSIQQKHKGGDYLLRCKLNGRWFRSKAVSIEDPSGMEASAPVMPNHDAELERLKALIESQRLEIERDRQAREQRNHEVQLKMLEALGARGNQATTPTITELIAGVRGLKDLSGNGSALASVKELLEVADQINTMRGDKANGEGEGWLSYLKPILPELARMIPAALAARPMAGAPVAAVQPEQAGALGAPTPVAQSAVEQSNTPGLTDQQFFAAKRQALSYALNMARLGRNPGVYAAMAIEAIDLQGDAAMARLLTEILEAKDFEVWFADLQKLEPGAVTQKPWFADFFASVRETIATQGEATEGI